MQTQNCATTKQNAVHVWSMGSDFPTSSQTQKKQNLSPKCMMDSVLKNVLMAMSLEEWTTFGPVLNVKGAV